MIKHTPGPWGTIFGHDFITIVAVGNKFPIVCRVKNEITPRKLTGEDYANARLIAAAPDLLEALGEFLRNPGGDYTEEIARTAIAKATGESE